MNGTYRIAPDVTVLSHAEPVPGKGFLPIQSYLLSGKQPVLVDTGAVRTRDEFMAQLEQVIDPADIAWIVLTHPDTDHAGALPLVLEKAPKARLVVNWISTGKLSASMVPPMPRIRWVNAGESLAAGDRVLHFLRPPMYDCPSTSALFDSKSRALFTSDAFGAFVPEMTRTFVRAGRGRGPRGDVDLLPRELAVAGRRPSRPVRGRAQGDRRPRAVVAPVRPLSGRRDRERRADHLARGVVPRRRADLPPQPAGAGRGPRERGPRGLGAGDRVVGQDRQEVQPRVRRPPDTASP